MVPHGWRIQELTYAEMWFIFPPHLALDAPLAWMNVHVILFEGTSWIEEWERKARKGTITAVHVIDYCIYLECWLWLYFYLKKKEWKLRLTHRNKARKNVSCSRVISYGHSLFVHSVSAIAPALFYVGCIHAPLVVLDADGARSWE